jgi:hypothetical protein
MNGGHSVTFIKQELVGCSITMLRNGVPLKPKSLNGFSNDIRLFVNVSSFSMNDLNAKFNFFLVSRSD